MSVVLTNMDMPNSCSECRLKTRCEYALANGWLNNKRDDKCPLKSYKEHKTGKWINRRTIIGAWKVDTVICSECRKEFGYDAETGINAEDYNFCPHCGAKMEE